MIDQFIADFVLGYLIGFGLMSVYYLIKELLS
jgi:hypothetical protein